MPDSATQSIKFYYTVLWNRLSDLEDANDSQLQEQSQPAGATNKRPCSNGDESSFSNSPPSKVPKHHNSLDETILAKKIGMLALCVYAAM